MLKQLDLDRVCVVIALLFIVIAICLNKDGALIAMGSLLVGYLVGKVTTTSPDIH